MYVCVCGGAAISSTTNPSKSRPASANSLAGYLPHVGTLIQKIKEAQNAATQYLTTVLMSNILTSLLNDHRHLRNLRIDIHRRRLNSVRRWRSFVIHPATE